MRDEITALNFSAESASTLRSLKTASVHVEPSSWHDDVQLWPDAASRQPPNHGGGDNGGGEGGGGAGGGGAGGGGVGGGEGDSDGGGGEGGGGAGGGGAGGGGVGVQKLEIIRLIVPLVATMESSVSPRMRLSSTGWET